MDDIFKHKSIILPENSIVISPSQINNFFAYPSVWFKDNLTNEGKSFKGNTASIIGTCCHYLYDLFAKQPEYFVANKEQIYEDLNKELYNYLRSDLELQTTVDEIEVLAKYPEITRAVINNYISSNLPTKSERSVYIKLKDYDNIYLAGTIDNITNNIIVDYKNVGVKPNTDIIPFNYKIQLLAYWYILNELGENKDWIRLVYGVAPTKTLAARCFTVTERISDEDKQLIIDTIKLIAESITKCKQDNSLIPIVFKSMNLQGYTL